MCSSILHRLQQAHQFIGYAVATHSVIQMCLYSIYTIYDWGLDRRIQDLPKAGRCAESPDPVGPEAKPLGLVGAKAHLKLKAF